jgi:hypothetical protein
MLIYCPCIDNGRKSSGIFSWHHGNVLFVCFFPHFFIAFFLAYCPYLSVPPILNYVLSSFLLFLSFPFPFYIFAFLIYFSLFSLYSYVLSFIFFLSASFFLSYILCLLKPRGRLQIWNADGTDSRLCPVAGFVITVVNFWCLLPES